MEAIITTIIMISLFLIIRRLIQGKISAKIQYGLWLIVAIKLLTIFIPMPESPFSILNIQKIFENKIELKQEIKQEINQEINQVDSVIQTLDADSEPLINNGNIAVNQNNQVIKQSLKTKNMILSFFWILYLLGVGLIIVKMILENGCLYRYLKSKRIKVRSQFSILPVYLVDGLKTPFLFGRSIYIPTNIDGDPQRIKHILAHENCHYMQGDLIWGFVRGICIALHWYNPFVWLAIKYSKQDAELACDERAVKCLGEKERISYAETLVNLIISQNQVKDLLVLSTSMSGSKKGIKERIIMITKRPRTLLSVLGFTIISIVAVGCTTFTNRDSNTLAVESKETMTEENETMTEENETQQLSVDQVATVSENTSEASIEPELGDVKTEEINYLWYEEDKIYKRADGVRFKLGYLGDPNDIPDENYIKEVEKDPKGIKNIYFQFLIMHVVDGVDYRGHLSIHYKEFIESNEDYISYVFEEETGGQMFVNYYYKTDTVKIIDNWDDGEDYNGEYK